MPSAIATCRASERTPRSTQGTPNDQIGNDSTTASGSSVSTASFINTLENLGGDIGAQGLGSGIGLQFPIFDNPLDVIGILLGQTENLITWQLPTLSLSGGFDIPIGPIPVGPIPLTIDISGSVRAPP